jgi:hypothetical protein
MKSSDKRPNSEHGCIEAPVFITREVGTYQNIPPLSQKGHAHLTMEKTFSPSARVPIVLTF